MHKRLGFAVIAAVGAGALFVSPVQASSKGTHRLLRSAARALHAPKGTGSSQGRSVPRAWTPAAPIPVGVAETGGGAAVGNRFYVIGGYDNSGAVVNNNQLYNRNTNSWISKAPIPGAGGGWADAAFCTNPDDGTIHVVNGVDGISIFSAHQVYERATDTWTFAANPNTPTDGNFYSQDSGCQFIDGKMYLFGGYGFTDLQGSPQVEQITWVYDPATDAWADTGQLMNHPRLWMGYTGRARNAFVAGGTDNISTLAPINSIESFSPIRGWAASPDLPTALLSPSAAIIHQHHFLRHSLVVAGGFDSSFVAQDTTYRCGFFFGTCTTVAGKLPAAKGFAAWATGSTFFNAGGYDSSSNVLTSAEYLGHRV